MIIIKDITLETEIKEKNPPNPKPKKQKKTKPVECMLSNLIGCLNFRICFITTFNLGSNPFLRGGFKYKVEI
jgi:hypothetical protein